ncbi:hypothetical protein HPB50_015866 [Hyalomma asiaticum]|uniref:Uncharacterized protein n=1 Tax=Hyalomma asiaticum TaxID=266040 RepID=A0ACB7S9A8_HYAAI|nr:hypothetical protein HPB50_015866 [Hyalomma asiaticum]
MAERDGKHLWSSKILSVGGEQNPELEIGAHGRCTHFSASPKCMQKWFHDYTNQFAAEPLSSDLESSYPRIQAMKNRNLEYCRWLYGTPRRDGRGSKHLSPHGHSLEDASEINFCPCTLGMSYESSVSSN